MSANTKTQNKYLKYAPNDAFSLGDFKIVQWLSPVIDIKRDGENVYAITKHVVNY
jgi:hypothetical protein